MPVGPYDAAIGEALRSTRADAEMTQDELAQALTIDAGISWRQSTVAKVESGARSLSAAELWATAVALGVELEALVPQGPMLRARGHARESTGTTAAARAGRRARCEEWSRRADTTNRAARALGVPVQRVEGLAFVLWGQSFYAERDYRVSVARRSPQAGQASDAEIRRQVAREMIAELIEDWEEDEP